MSLFDKPFIAPGSGRTYLPNTKSSLRRFQVYHKLPVTGQLDSKTAAKMKATNTRIQPVVPDGGPTVSDQMRKFGGDPGMKPPPSKTYKS